MCMKEKKNYYAYIVPKTRESGVTSSWAECEKKVKGVQGARFMGFKTKEEAEAWLEAGSAYASPKPKKIAERGIYFDAGTGRGDGVEISVTNEKGNNLLAMALPKKLINKHGKHGLYNATNNYGELLACKYALEIAQKVGVKKVFGDSKIIIEFWSLGMIKRKEVAPDTVQLADQVTKLRREFEKDGGEVLRISGDDNPADLGFHR